MADNSAINVSDDELEILKVRWASEQNEMRARLITHDCEPWQSGRDLKLVGGMDLSFSQEDSSLACCILVVCTVPDMAVIYEDSMMVTLSVPYVPGFLAFREIDPCLNLLKKLKDSQPSLIPQVILFDGNGILHPRGLGLASHFGIVADICTIGVAKNLHQMGSIVRDETHLTQIYALEEPGEMVPLEGGCGVALKTSKGAKRPVYVSVGHRISLETAIWVVMQCVAKYRIPEPTRQADIRSREEIRKLESSKSSVQGKK